MKKIFTKQFFSLASGDQAAIVLAALRDLENQCWATELDRQRAARQRRRIEKKAMEYGIINEV